MADWSMADWRRSTLCGTNSCVEVAFAASDVAIRDSKLRRGPVLQFDRVTWEEFLAGVRNGEFDRAPEIGG
jgi:Domain of unknown function (DUF397)